MVSPDNHNWLNHIYRENNGIADSIADIAARCNQIHWQAHHSAVINFTAIRTLFDGSAGKAGLGHIPATGIVIQTSSPMHNKWQQAAQLGVPLPQDSTSMYAETSACLLAVELTRFLITNHTLPTIHQIRDIVLQTGTAHLTNEY